MRILKTRDRLCSPNDRISSLLSIVKRKTVGKLAFDVLLYLILLMKIKW